MSRFARDSRLIFDLGMNNGDDTDFYLGRGFKVIALEANPSLCEAAQRRFAPALAEQRLTILNAAVWDRPGEATFYVNLDNDHWSSLDIGWAGRDASRCREIKVRCMTLDELFAAFGVPHYLKIDVEGVDLAVLEQLGGAEKLPLYVSVEDCRFGPRYMEILAACGYDGFKLLDQSQVSRLVDGGRAFPAGASGPFGNEVPGDWLSHAEMMALYSTTVRDAQGNRIAPRTRWWDIHCTSIEQAKAA
ncbi:MAG: FkbM family methyltransferase [Pseudolabrys sp.]|jgi:FkbM family methyltransferase